MTGADPRSRPPGLEEARNGCWPSRTYGVLFFLDIAALFVVIAAWFTIVVTGRYPRGMSGVAERVIGWNVRLTGYALTLVTDLYPPSRLAT